MSSGNHPITIAQSKVEINGGTVEYVPNYSSIMQDIHCRAKIIRAELSRGQQQIRFPDVQYSTNNVGATIHALDVVMHPLLDFPIKVEDWVNEIWFDDNKYISEFYNFFQSTFYSVVDWSEFNTACDRLKAAINECCDSVGYSEERKQISDLMKEARHRVELSAKAIKSGVYIAAPSVAALYSNELTYANAKNQSERFDQEANYLYKKALDIAVMLSKQAPTKLMNQVIDITEQFLSMKEKEAKELMVAVKGEVATKKEWQSFQQNPCEPWNYVSLLKACAVPTGISDLLAAFSIDKNDVLRKSQEVLCQALATKGIDASLKEYALLINNLSQLLDTSQVDIIKRMLTPFMEKIAHSLKQICFSLPERVKEQPMSGGNELHTAVVLMNGIISREDFHQLQTIFASEWPDRIQQALNLPNRDTDLYNQIIGLLHTRISMFRTLCSKRDAELEELNQKLASAEKELNNLGLFAFSAKKHLKQQISEFKHSIEFKKQEYNQKLQEI